MPGVHSLEEIDVMNPNSGIDVRRIPTGYRDLDIIYGRSDVLDASGLSHVEYGLPCGKISYWAGVAGVGKTRLAIAVSKNISRMNGTVMVFEGEVRPDEFRQWAGNDVIHPEKYFVSDHSELPNICDTLLKFRPNLVIIDSANMIEGSGCSSHDRVIYPQLRSIIQDIGCHCIMTAQLNQDKTVKGGTTPGHLVDVEAHLDWLVPIGKMHESTIFPDIEGCFWLETKKNRCGPVGGAVTFAHERHGIRFINSTVSPFSPKIADDRNIKYKILPPREKK